MPIHDWSRIQSGLFHHFHQHWSIEITRALNCGNLHNGLSALVEQRAGPKEPSHHGPCKAAVTPLKQSLAETAPIN